MSNWTVDEALKWADTWGPTDGEPPTGDQLALATLSRALRAAAAELASMRRCFDAADRERSELRDRAERAEAENRALRRLLAVRVSGASLYTDDGGLEDNSKPPFIDYYLDSPAVIHCKLQERERSELRERAERAEADAAPWEERAQHLGWRPRDPARR